MVLETFETLTGQNSPNNKDYSLFIVRIISNRFHYILLICHENE